MPVLAGTSRWLSPPHSAHTGVSTFTAPQPRPACPVPCTRPMAARSHGRQPPHAAMAMPGRGVAEGLPFRQRADTDIRATAMALLMPHGRGEMAVRRGHGTRQPPPAPHPSPGGCGSARQAPHARRRRPKSPSSCSCHRGVPRAQHGHSRHTRRGGAAHHHYGGLRRRRGRRAAPTRRPPGTARQHAHPLRHCPPPKTGTDLSQTILHYFAKSDWFCTSQ